VTPALQSLFEGLRDCSLDNHYGPSETHVATANRLRGDAADWPRLPSIGYPIANTSIYLLDDLMRPVPIGVAGQIYIGGDCLARGYLEPADLTAQRFIEDPFSDEIGSRLYQTGDLARYAANGSVEYLGRVDGQVKLRGYRIELGEIETVLMEQDGVQACAAMLREDQAGDRRLVAYYVGAGLVAKALREGMRKRLPDYMMPSALVELEKLPLTPSGKLNRRDLPAPDNGSEMGEDYVAPRTEIEHRLVEIWQEVLDLDRIGVHDNFFELGGHSLLVTRVTSRVRDSMKIELSVANLFEFSSVAELADFIATTQWVKRSRDIATSDKASDNSDKGTQRQVGEL
jgi:acyl carrier protein